MKYYYKIFVNEGVEESLKSIKASEDFIKKLTESADYKGQIEQKMTEFYVAYDVQKAKKGKSIWSWCPIKDVYKGDWTYKGEIHPQRKGKIDKLKKLWEND